MFPTEEGGWQNVGGTLLPTNKQLYIAINKGPEPSCGNDLSLVAHARRWQIRLSHCRRTDVQMVTSGVIAELLTRIYYEAGTSRAYHARAREPVEDTEAWHQVERQT